jgi:hypothetical protein
MNPHESRMGIVQLVTDYKMSSISMISEQLGIDENTTREYLQELVNEGELKGFLTEDGCRFFKSDAQITSAPIVGLHQELIQETYDTRLGKLIFLSGIVLIVLGQTFIRIFGNNPITLGLGEVLVIFGYAALIGGLVYTGVRIQE